MNPTLPGLDALIQGKLSHSPAMPHRGKVGLLTNPTGRTIGGLATLPALRNMGMEIAVLFSPEHGPMADLEGDISSGVSQEGLTIHSLYGATRRPTPAMLQGLNLLICDLQDVGARFYTYFSTIAHCMDEAAKCGVAMLILDRPNPLGGTLVEGPTLEPAYRSFVGYTGVPVVHGLTMGELCLWYKAEQALELDLQVAAMHNWARSTTWEQTGLPWRRPSPNLPDANAASWYPCLCLMEFSDLCVGRGTDSPFRILAAPWLDGPQLCQDLQQITLFPWLEVASIGVTPSHAVHAGLACSGIKLSLKPGYAHPVAPVSLGLVIMLLLAKRYPNWREEQLPNALPLLGSSASISHIEAGNVEALLSSCAADAQDFRRTRAAHLLY